MESLRQLPQLVGDYGCIYLYYPYPPWKILMYWVTLF